MEKQRLEACLNVTHYTTEYDNEKILTLISKPTYQVKTNDPMLFCIDTGASISCIGENALKRIITHTDRTANPIAESEHNFRLRYTVIRSKGMVELMLQTPATFCYIPILLDFVDVYIPAFLGLDALDGNNLLVDNVTGHLWNSVIISKQPLRYDYIWENEIETKRRSLIRSFERTNTVVLYHGKATKAS